MKFSPFYSNYLQSEAWGKKRRSALKRARCRCRFWFCNETERLEVRHRTYARLGCERITDLTVYCHRHHQVVTFFTRLFRFLLKVLRFLLKGLQ